MEQLREYARIRHVLEDPGAQSIARVYAHAFLDAAAAHGVEDALEEFGSFVEEVLAAHPDLWDLLTSSIVGRDEKIGVIDRVVAPFGSELFTNFLRVLARHERLDLLPVILRECRVRYELHQGRKRVDVTTARPLSEEVGRRIHETLAQSLPFEPAVRVHVDPALLGGMVIRVEDTIYDGSLRTRLRDLRDRLHKRTIHEIQSGRDRFGHSTGD